MDPLQLLLHKGLVAVAFEFNLAESFTVNDTEPLHPLESVTVAT
jgi:hypothetical protein